MKLDVYKGFNCQFLNNLENEPLIQLESTKRKNVLSYDKMLRKKLSANLLSMDDDDHYWITYEEFTFIKGNIESAIEDYDLEVTIYKNNILPECYPLEFQVEEPLYNEIISFLENEKFGEESDDCRKYLEIYNSIFYSGNDYYGCFYNYEFDSNLYKVVNYYSTDVTIENNSLENNDFIVYCNEDIETYVKTFEVIKKEKPTEIAFCSSKGRVSKIVENSLKAYCLINNIRIVNYHEEHEIDSEIKEELIDIAKNEIKIPNFEDFRKIKFYKDPDISNETIEISQAKIIMDILEQAELANDPEKENKARDIFITASTGAGKSVMFQIPAVYLAKKYNKLTIIIEPVKALMQDQKEALNARGYYRVETFNSDLISQVEKEQVLNRIKNGEVDLLYLSPETLLSYSIQTIIGDRDIGLLIVDEAHIVTTWGVGFRPDYWYLGSYINRLRSVLKYGNYKNKKASYHFPICSFTATAINGGIDDSISDTVISLYMKNPIKYIGYIKRNDIEFDIKIKNNKKLPLGEYETAKAQDMNKFLKRTFLKKEKSIVYFPYASYAYQAKNQSHSFAELTIPKEKIGIYAGKNNEGISQELFAEQKRETFDKFKSGKIKAIYATKAFGMGVDVNDINNVYHYAITGNLSDYVQEIGRAARKIDITGKAIIDYYPNDLYFMKVLFGMSQIRQWQVKKVLEDVYNVYKTKQSKSFLITPESFSYIFTKKKDTTNEKYAINNLKTSLLMLEKDLNDKSAFKIFISRPQSVFTKAYVAINNDYKSEVLQSKYGQYFKFVEKGRNKEQQYDKGNTIITDIGDIYTVDLKGIWENYYQNISFPQFKFWYFNNNPRATGYINIMPEIRNKISPRQKVTIDSHQDLAISDLKTKLLQDLNYIADLLYEKYGNGHFTVDDFIKTISKDYGKTKARLIANSLFDIVDPASNIVKRTVNEATSKVEYSIINGTLKEHLKKPTNYSNLCSKMNYCNENEYSSYIPVFNSDKDSINWNESYLKILSLFDYITYEMIGGEEPEIFIRLNDPDKIRKIVYGDIKYNNDYVRKAKQKHDRDVEVLQKFFLKLNSNEERWNYIENYFLGKDVLEDFEVFPDKEKLVQIIDKNKSYNVKSHGIEKWKDLSAFVDDDDISVLKEFAKSGLPLPEYLNTEIKEVDWDQDILMSWPQKNLLIFTQEVEDKVFKSCVEKGWNVFKINEVDLDRIKEVLI